MELKKDRYDLSVRRHVQGAATAELRRMTDTRPLSAIAELIRGQLLKEEDPLSGEYYLEVGVKDIGDDGMVRIPAKKLRLSGRMKDRAELQRLQPGDILLVTKGSVGKVGLVGGDCGDNWVASQSFQVVRLTSSNYIAKQEILYRYLSSPLIYNYLLEQLTGTTIPVVKTSDIKNLPVPNMPLDEQHKIVKTHKKIIEAYVEINELKARIEKLRHRRWSLRQD
jgi:restriction endonuclease S subunit